MGIKIKKVQPKRAVSKRTNPKKAASKNAAVAKAVPKKAAPKKAAPKKAAPKKRGDKGDPSKTILVKLAELDQIGVKEVKEIIILQATGYARHDSTGFRKAAKKLTKELEYALRRTKDKQTTWALTESGRNHLLETGVIIIPDKPKSNDEFHDQLFETMKKFVKAPQAKLETVFDLLKDGDWHSTQDILSATGYNRTDSTGYRSIMAGMKKLDLLEKSGKNVRFNDNFFLFGRP